MQSTNSHTAMSDIFFLQYLLPSLYLSETSKESILFIKYQKTYLHVHFVFALTDSKAELNGEARVQLCSNGNSSPQYSTAVFKDMSFNSGNDKI